MIKLIEQFHTYYLSILAHLKPNTGKKQSMKLLSQKQPFTTSGVLNYGGNQEFKSYLPTDTARKILHNEPILSSGGWSIPVKWKLLHYLDLPPKRVA